MEVGAAGVMHAPMNANALPESSSCISSKWIAGESGLTNRSNFGHDAGQNMGLRICTTDSKREGGRKEKSVIISSSSDDDDKDLSDADGVGIKVRMG